MQSLKIFQFKQNLYVISKILGSILMFLFFFVLVILLFFLFTPDQELITGIIYIASMLGFSYLSRIFFSRFVFKNIGQLYIDNDKLIIKENNRISHVHSSLEINHLKIIYMGDDRWKPIDSFIQKYDYNNRYRIKRASAKSHIDTFDYIMIDSEKFLIKIKNENDKLLLFKIAKWAKDNEVNYDFIERIPKVQEQLILKK